MCRAGSNRSEPCVRRTAFHSAAERWRVVNETQGPSFPQYKHREPAWLPRIPPAQSPEAWPAPAVRTRSAELCFGPLSNREAALQTPPTSLLCPVLPACCCSSGTLVFGCKCDLRAEPAPWDLCVKLQENNCTANLVFPCSWRRQSASFRTELGAVLLEPPLQALRERKSSLLAFLFKILAVWSFLCRRSN